MAPQDDGQSKPPEPASAPSGGDSKRLSEILSDVFAEQERVAPLEMQLQQLGFFRKELRHMITVVEDAPRTGWTPEARSALEGVLDTASDLQEALAARYALPSFSVSRAQQMPFDEAGLGVAIDDEDPGSAGMSSGDLELALEGLRDEVQVVRESLVANTALADVLERSPDFMREMARGEFLEFCSVLKELVEGCLATLARIPTDEGLPAAPVQRVAPLPPVAPRPPAAEAPRFVAPTPAAPAPGPTVAAQPAPAASAAPAPAPPAPAEEAAGPTYQHRSEEEAVSELQAFFNDNSPEGTLLKAQEIDFTRLVAQIVGVICAGVTFTPADLATRIRVLRDTFAVRKRLNNTLTVREFKSFFGTR